MCVVSCGFDGYLVLEGVEENELVVGMDEFVVFVLTSFEDHSVRSKNLRA
jgi:hypothetical protein